MTNTAAVDTFEVRVFSYREQEWVVDGTFDNREDARACSTYYKVVGHPYRVYLNGKRCPTLDF